MGDFAGGFVMGLPKREVTPTVLSEIAKQLRCSNSQRNLADLG